MTAIEVIPIGTAAFSVELRDGEDVTRHEVTVPDGYAAELGVGDVAYKRLVEESMRFLLEREPKEQIMSSFELPTIARFFPGYPDVIRERLD